MRFSLTIIFTVLTLCSVTHVYAQGSDTAKKGFVGHMEDLQKYTFGMPEVDFDQRYMKDGKTPNNNQWDDDNWKPEYWVDAKGSTSAVIEGLYGSGVLVDQYEDDVPVLEVGRTFLQLSPVDQRHVIEFVDYAFKITATKPHGIFYVVFDNGNKGDELLGVYTVNGLQMQ